MSSVKNPSGPDHPNYRHGKYCGQKTIRRVRGPVIPKTGCVPSVRAWISAHIPPGKSFGIYDLSGHIPPFTDRSISWAMQKLANKGELIRLHNPGARFGIYLKHNPPIS